MLIDTGPSATNVHLFAGVPESLLELITALRCRTPLFVSKRRYLSLLAIRKVQLDSHPPVGTISMSLPSGTLGVPWRATGFNGA